MLPGDIVLVHGQSKYSKAISFGQAQRFKGPKHYKYWTHVAVVVSSAGDLIEALWPEVALTNISKYKDIDHAIVDISPWASYEDRQQVVAFAMHCKGRKYGVGEAASLGQYCLTGGSLRWAVDNQLICSALAAEALCRTKIIFPEEPLWMFPAHHAEFFQVPGR